MKARSGVVLAIILSGAMVWAGTSSAEPRARANRLAVSLGFGLGSAAMSSFGQFSEDGTAAMLGKNPGLSADGAPKSQFQINGEIAFRYYFPYHLLGQIGFGTLYNSGSAKLTATVGAAHADGEAVFHNLAMEIPILVGGYYVVAERLYLFGAVGPSIHFFDRSYWDLTGQFSGGIPDYKGDAGVGFVGLAGADYMVGEQFAVGLEVRGRALNAGELKEINSSFVVTPSTLGKGASTEPYDLDFSGISVGLYARLFAL